MTRKRRQRSVSPEMAPLLNALKARIEELSPNAEETLTEDGLKAYMRSNNIFMQLEIRQDHMSLDFWLPPEKLEEVRSTEIGRAHPFLENEAVKVRFERAGDITRVARWLREAHEFAAAAS